MKSIVILLLLICLAKLAGAQVPKCMNYQNLHTAPTGASPWPETAPVTGPVPKLNVVMH
jgi:hypothetical protein